jgi:hypothetical protein
MARDEKFETRDEDLGATDWRAYFDSSCFRVWHLAGKERTFKIGKVTRLTSEMVNGGKREIKKQPKLELIDAKGNKVPLPLLLNKTNAKTIARLYGNNPGAWVGKLITLHPATTSVGGEDVDCIRVRNEAPRRTQKAKVEQAPAPVTNGHDDGPLHREPGDDDEPPMGALESDRVQ